MSLKTELMGYAVGTALLVGGAAWLYSLPESYRKEGRAEVVADYERQSDILNARRDAEIEAAKAENLRNLREAKAYYETEMSKTDERYRLARADGLRWKSAAGNSSGTKTTTETGSSCVVNEVRENRLPEHIETGLFDLAREADRITLKYNSLLRIVERSQCFIVVEP